METTLTSGQLALQLKVFDEKKMTPDRWNRILSSGIFADICDPSACLDDRGSVRKALKLGVALPESITLLVDYRTSLDHMIARGGYDWKKENITAKKFPVVGNGVEEFEFKIFHFGGRPMSSEAAVERIEAAGFEPGKIEHLLSFGEKYPEEQRKYPIVALGSVAGVGDDRIVPCLDRDDTLRFLSIHWWDGDWDGRYRFLAVRPVKIAESLAAAA